MMNDNDQDKEKLPNQTNARYGAPPAVICAVRWEMMTSDDASRSAHCGS